MTTFVERNATHLGVDRIGSSVTAFALYQNLLAAFEKDPTAVAAGAKLANDYVEEAMIAAGQVSQSKLKSTFGDVGSGGTTGNLTLPGGEYGFYPRIWMNTAGTQNARIGEAAGSLSPTTNIYLDPAGQMSFARQRYIQASPPYDLGDGDVPLFVFVVVDGSGKVLLSYTAEDPPWANNGPTDIRPDGVDKDGKPFKLVRPRPRLAELRNPALRELELAKLREAPVKVEVTQAMKQADMPLIPHPFLGNDLTGRTVLLLDPVSDLVHRLHELMLAGGESASELLHGGLLVLGNTPLARRAPPGVVPVAVTWK